MGTSQLCDGTSAGACPSGEQCRAAADGGVGRCRAPRDGGFEGGFGEGGFQKDGGGNDGETDGGGSTDGEADSAG
jgi:hypothetical protein